MTFPVSHTTLDAVALAAELQRRYHFAGQVRCRLVARGSNDLYQVQCGAERHALRVSRAGHRSAAETRFELELLAFLARLGLPVPAPRPLVDGSTAFTVDAPDGTRTLALMTWFDGGSLDRGLTTEDAHGAGRLLAELHRAAQAFVPSEPKIIDTVARIECKRQYLDELLPAGSGARDAFERGLSTVESWFSEGCSAALVRGATHGDFQFANVMRTASSALAAIDFDDCGIDLLVKDVITFEWRARLEELPQAVITAFIAGYETVRPLSAAEREALPVLRVARDLYLLVSYAAYIDRIGPVDGFQRQGRLVELLVEDLARVEQDVAVAPPRSKPVPGTSGGGSSASAPSVGDSARRTVRRRFAYVGGRHVHYRVCGRGPAIVLLHDSPRSSLLHLDLMGDLGDEFTVYALDTPGYGQSDPLSAVPRPEIDDFADALAATLEELGLSPAILYAYHTSSKIALACAVRHPAAVGQLIIDGISLPAQPADDGFVERYMSPFIPDPAGRYVAEQWTKIRDLHRFFPWFQIDAATRMATDEPRPERLHEYALDFFAAGPNYASAYGAAMRYLARGTLERLSIPTVVLARRDDVLFGFLDVAERLLPRCGRVERLPADVGAWRTALRRLFRAATGAVTASEPPPAASWPVGIARQYVHFEHGDVLVSVGGDGPGTLLIHAPPGSAADMDEVLRRMASERRVVALDLPGCNLSDPLPEGASAEDWTALLLRVADECGLQCFAVIASGLSTPLALLLARHARGRVSALVLDGGLEMDRSRRAALARQYVPYVTPTRDGTHFSAMFHRLRDEELQWPWFDSSAGARRGGGRGLNAERLHRRLVATLMQVDHHGDACRAALEVDPGPLLRGLQVPTLLVHREGDPYYASAVEAQLLLPLSQFLPLPHGCDLPADALVRFLNGASVQTIT